MDTPENKVERRQHLKRFAKENVLQIIYEQLPEEQKDPFVEYRNKWNLVDEARPDLAFPLCISLELVAACNLHCAHCVRNRPQWRQRFPELFSGSRMGFDTFRRIVDECASEGLPSLWLGCSGEAFLEKRVVEMLEYAHEQGIIDLILTTNGTLLEQDIIDRIVEIPITRLNISVDAFTANTYRTIRGGNFDRLVSSIHYLLEKRKELHSSLPVVRLTFIDMPANRHEKEKFVTYWKELVELVDIQKFIDFDIINNHNSAAAKDFHCSCPWRLVDIMANGDLVPCNSFYALPKLIMGNIHKQSIGEIWRSEKFKRFRADMKERHYTDSCLACFSAQTIS